MPAKKWMHGWEKVEEEKALNRDQESTKAVGDRVRSSLALFKDVQV